jgi:hypothetical protein
MKTEGNTIESLQELLGGVLPSDYADFLTAADFSSVEGMDYWLPHPSGSWIESVDQVYTLDALIQRMTMEMDLRNQGFGDHPNGTLPIAGNGSGDDVLLIYSQDDFGSIHHAFIEEGDMDEPWRGVYRLADSFSDWRGILQKIPEDQKT